MSAQLRATLAHYSRMRAVAILAALAAFAGAPALAAGKRIYISVDLEGIAGVVSRDQLDPSHFEYDLARQWMTGEVAAAIRGATAGGASQFVVSDSHGNGETLLVDLLPDTVQVVRSRPRPLAMMEGIQSEHFDGVFLIGYHAGARNAKGLMAHTFANAVFREVTLNGRVVSEGEWNAALASEYDAPILLFTGDDAAVEETVQFLGTGLRTVTVKRSHGTFAATSLTPAAAQAAIERAARDAVSHAGVLVPKVTTPVRITVTFRDTLLAETFAYLPEFERIDVRTIRFEAPSVTQATMRMQVLQYFGSLASGQ